MSDSFNTEILERAFASTRGVLANVTADQLDHSTPCASWDVRALGNHIVGGTYFFAGSVRGDFKPAANPPDFAAGDFVATYDDGAAQAVAEFGAPGNAEKMVTVPFGTLPGAAFMGLAATDAFAHGWDLARATGQDDTIDPVDLERLWRSNNAIPPDVLERLRTPEAFGPGVVVFGPEVPVPVDAPLQNRLLGMIGRDADWQPDSPVTEATAPAHQQ